MLLNLQVNSVNTETTTPPPIQPQKQLSKFKYNSRHYSKLRDKIKLELFLPKTIIVDDNEFTSEERSLGVRSLQGAFKNEFKIVKTLGQGCSAMVKKIERISDGKEFACKILRLRDDEQIFNIKYEYLHLRKIKPHSKIVQVYELLIDRIKHKIYIVMELIEGKEMFEALKNGQNYTEEKARCLFRQVMQAIHFLHENYICHRDLKPNNILVSHDDNIKITDFNVSKFSDNYKKKISPQKQVQINIILFQMKNKGQK